MFLRVVNYQKTNRKKQPPVRTPTCACKHSCGNRDWAILLAILGTYTAPTEPRQQGSWSGLAPPQMVDAGGLYASKDFADATGRRLVTGFGHNPGSRGLTLLREVTLHPELSQLVFSPLPELATLGGATSPVIATGNQAEVVKFAVAAVEDLSTQSLLSLQGGAVCSGSRSAPSSGSG